MEVEALVSKSINVYIVPALILLNCNMTSLTLTQNGGILVQPRKM